MIRDTALPVWYSKISTSADQSDDTKPFNISVSTGCMADEMKEVLSNFSAISSENDLRLVVQCPWEGDATMFSVQKILKEWGYIENKGVKLAINAVSYTHLTLPTKRIV